MLVDPSAVVLPTSKSDGAARLGTTLPEGKLPSVDVLIEEGDSSDLDKFSDINSQDDAVTREKKERKRSSLLRKGMTSLVSGANMVIQRTGSAMATLTKINTQKEESSALLNLDYTPTPT